MTVASAVTPASCEGTGTDPAGPGRRKGISASAAGLRRQFPPRLAQAGWPQTRQSTEEIIESLTRPPLLAAHPGTRRERYRGVTRLLSWLDVFPGETWQDRWLASGAQDRPGQEWAGLPATWLASQGSGSPCDRGDLSTGLLMLVCADVLRPGLAWMLSRRHIHLTAAMTAIRDPQGLNRLGEMVAADPVIITRIGRTSILRIALIMACKGGAVADVTAGDCVELLDTLETAHADGGRAKTLFYLLLRDAGVLGGAAPPSIRAFGKASGQLTAEELVDRHQLACTPVRDLLVGYLRERQPAVDYATLRQLAGILAGLFWADLEAHHPGIASLQLSPETAAGWKERIQTKKRTVRNAAGELTEVRTPRVSAKDALYEVRAFYLDLAQWAAEDPARWSAWAVPCPIAAAELSRKKGDRHRKARMDARTRERLPVLPALARAASERRAVAAARLDAGQAARPGSEFTAAGQTFRRPLAPQAGGGRVWADDLRTAARHDLTFEENDAFWAWATIEVLRHTGIRVEELLELSHHAVTEYRLPSTGELVPLLQIAPSKTDTERLILISPELADVLSAIICRLRGPSGAIPSVPSYDCHEKAWNPPMPLLFQRPAGGENRAYTPGATRDVLRRALSAAGLTGADGQLLNFTPHDFRRLFITDAVTNGLPPHIAQVICGHRDINTTMGYKAIYPADAIEAHRAFISRRRGLRPGEEYRMPTDEEWDAFLSHFEKRKLSVGTCARAFGTPCIHEHACVRCALLRPDPAQRPRLAEIRDNLHARIAEAVREGWRGEIEGLQVSLAGASSKIAQIDAAGHRAVTSLGMPAFSQIAARANPGAPAC
jgi:integrase